MKIEINKSYKPRDGREAFVAAENPNAEVDSSNRFVGWVDDCPRTWGIDGFWDSEKDPDEWDLIAEWQDPPEKRVLEGYVNVYPKADGALCSTKEEADRVRSNNCIACVHVKVEYEIWEGL